MKCQWAPASFPTSSMDGRMALTGQHRPSVNSLVRLSNRCCTGSALVVRLERVVPDLDSNAGYANQLAAVLARFFDLGLELFGAGLRQPLSSQLGQLAQIKRRYLFEGPRGKETLADLFEKSSQLVVYHFMFPTEWEEGCPHCSFWADNFNGIGVTLKHRDVSFVAVSRAPLSKIEAFKKRMGWGFKWVSAFENEFNRDYRVTFV